MFYRQSILIFGFILPLLACVGVFAGGLAIKSNATASFENKQTLFKATEMNRFGSIGLETQVGKRREHFERWNEQMKNESSNSITSHLKEIGDMLPAKEFQQTAAEYPPGKAGFATSSAQKSSQVRLAFRGTFRSMQRAFLELETRMPQLQLQELKIDPSSSSSSGLNFQVTYTAWEK
ncbi:MAG: hypothetical protein EAZ65_02520 [Verrucomicrobia bacterium]|nr:MAG: hypothetical protein EAZ84_04780 [Verrucomicrobiota bacterium]TAE88871.1 MAG: hypothetical protein EAZ82_02205 [Verrucomicrobiota bacterium]TAF27288.1 MAG: hypothetical protein EAZ71_02170 [Verrucomicrobiota bacterium]TAF42421.1 MAG: hypothetical protein EAZ65_02520 [Verrucomicrobiota bacterium]